MKGEFIECPKCGERFDGSVPAWLQNLDQHLKKEHDITELHDKRNELDSRDWRAAAEALDYDIKKKETITNSTGPKPVETGKTLVEEKIEEEEPVHGVLREKYKKSPGNKDRELPTEPEGRTHETKSKKGLQDLLPGAETASKWGGRALIFVTVLFAGYAAYKNFNQFREDVNSAGEGEEKTGSDSEPERSDERKVEANGELENKDNGHTETNEPVYRSYEDL